MYVCICIYVCACVCESSYMLYGFKKLSNEYELYCIEYLLTKLSNLKIHLQSSLTDVRI